MTWLRRGLVALVAIIVLGFIGFNVFKKQIATAAFERGVAQRAGVDASADLPDGLHVYICGAGSPMPDVARAGPCLAVMAGDKAFIFDVGSGSVRNLGSMGFPIENLQSVYLTHLHSDHIDGLGELMVIAWVGASRSEPLPIAGPPGTAQVVEGFNIAYQINSTYRIAHHGTGVANPDGVGAAAQEFLVPAGPSGKIVVHEDQDLKITAVRVEHAPVELAYAYRIDYKDRSVSISGDTIYDPRFVGLSEGVDLMLHEALDPEMVSTIGEQMAERGQANTAKIFFDILDYHASPEDAARSAEEAGADQLVIYHIVPPIPAEIIETVFLGDARKAFSGPIIVAKDGMMFTLPAGSETIERTRAF